MKKIRIVVASTVVMVVGMLSIVAPASAGVKALPKCEVKCPSMPGTTFCGGYCNEGQQPVCEYVTPGHTCILQQ